MKFLVQIFFFAAMLTGVSASFAQPTKTSTKTGNWTDATVWSPSGVPVTGDNVVIAAGHTVTTTGLTRTGAVTVNGTLSSSGSFTAGSLSGTGTGTVTGGTKRTLSFGGLNTNTTFSGLITGNANFRKTGTGTFTLSGSGTNTYSGNTSIWGGGKITLGAANRIPDESYVDLCGTSTLDLNGFNETIAGLNSTSGTCGSGSGHVVTNSSSTLATLTIKIINDSGGAGFSGSITGKLNLVVSGGGNYASQDLDGANTYTGTTLVSGGIVIVSATNAIPSSTKITLTSPGQLAMTANATCNTLTLGSLLQFAGTTHGSTSSAASNKNDTYFDVAYTGVLTATNGNVVKTSTKTGNWTDASVWSPSGVPATGDSVIIAAGHTVTTTGITRTGAVTVNGTLNSSGNFRAGSLSGTGTINSTSATINRILSFGTLNTNTTFSGVITGKAHFRKAGTGTFTLSGSGANTYSGNTGIEGGGTMRLGAANRIPDGSSLQLCGNSTFDLNGFNETIGDLSSISGTCGSTFDHIVTNSSATLATLTINLSDYGYGSYSGSITGKLNLVVSGGVDAYQDLDGANSYTGTTTVSGGVLNIAATAALPSATDITITSPGQVALNADATCNTLTLGATPQIPGTYGSTASLATTQDDTYFNEFGPGVLTVSSSLVNSPVERTSSELGSAQELPNNFDVKVLGNPSTSMFVLKIESNNFDEKVTLKIVDISGRIVEVKQNLYVGAMVELGMDYKAGSYFVEAIQGEQSKVIKLFKVVKN
jgi:autotransporter-associated beta strand protein